MHDRVAGFIFNMTGYRRTQANLLSIKMNAYHFVLQNLVNNVYHI